MRIRKPAKCLFHNDFFSKEYPMIFMLYEGITKASSITDGHKGADGWMVLTGIQWGTARSIADASAGNNREGTTPSVSEIVVTKTLDEASYKLFEESLSGTGKKATIHITKGDKKQTEYMEYLLENCLITGFSVGSNGDRPEETVAINFTKMEFNFSETDPKNIAKSPTRASWDLAASTGTGG
jgi:type VI secretion system secreted protein Hcp